MINITKASKEVELKMPWKNCIAIGRAYELLREDLLKHLRKIQKDIGYNYCRFHAVFDDDMAVVIRKKDGSIMYQWHHLDKVYDALLEMGLRPFVELNPMPKALASGDQTMFAYEMNVTPPKEYKEWYDLVYAFVNHIIDRYGIEEIRKWYFEVWNEPNLSGFWSGSKEEYFKLYDASAFAIKSIDPILKVGGPSSSKANWIEDIIKHCVSKNVPIDFVSTHLYPQDEYVVYEDRNGSPHKPGEFFADTFKEVYKIVKSSPLPNLEIHWTEWNTQCTRTTSGVSWSDNIYVDNHFAASFITKNCLEIDDQCNTMCYWVASDIFGEGGIPGSAFSNTYGLMTIHGIPKAAYNAFMFLKDMKGSLCNIQKSDSLESGFGLRATYDKYAYHVLLWNHKVLESEDDSVWKDKIAIPVDKKGKYLFVTKKIKKDSGSCYEAWVQMGRPHNLSQIEEKLLTALSHPEYNYKVVDCDTASVEIEFHLEPNEVLYIELRQQNATAVTLAIDDEIMNVWNINMSEKSR